MPYRNPTLGPIWLSALTAYFCQQRQGRAHGRGGQGQDQERARQVVQGLAGAGIGNRSRLAAEPGDKQQLRDAQQYRDQ